MPDVREAASEGDVSTRIPQRVRRLAILTLFVGVPLWLIKRAQQQQNLADCLIEEAPLGGGNMYVPKDGLYLDALDIFVTGKGQMLHNVHRAEACEGQDACVIHKPSEHSMRLFATNWRDGGPFDVKPPHMERICPHGVGHPDPDDVAYHKAHGRDYISVHGCDGCCREDS